MFKGWANSFRLWKKESGQLVPIYLSIVATLFFLWLYYSAYHHFDYVSAPGGDIYNHYQYILSLKQNGLKVFFSGYPKLFHLFVLILMNISGQPALTIMLYLIPPILVASAWSVGKIATVLADSNWAGFWALMMVLYVSTQPTQTLYDGGFPNIIAAHIFVPLLMLTILNYLHQGGRKRMAWIIGLTFLIIATHNFSIIYAIIIIISTIIYRFKFKSIPYLLGALVLLVGIWLSPLSSPLRSVLAQTGQLNNQNAIWPLKDYPNGISYLVVWLGLVGIIFLVQLIIKKNKNSGLAVMVLVWLLALAIGSQIKPLGFPVRLARDLATPLVISTSLAMVAIWRLLGKLQPNLGLILFQAIFASLCFVLAYPHMADRFIRITNYEPEMQYSAADQAAVFYIGENRAIAIDQNLPSIFQPTIHSIYPSLPFTAQEITTDKSIFQGVEYVFFEDSQSHYGQIYVRPLYRLGFHPIIKFTDPIKTVSIFQKN
jgi:hypothetical protein